MDFIENAYNYVFYEQADPRVKDWMFMKSPWFLFTTIITYLALIKVILPAHMKDRKPYPLNNTLRWYNVAQIVGNILATWGIATSGWTTIFHLGCLLPDYRTTPENMRMLNFLWWTFTLKLLELFETFFFILRKKEKQASFLHVYHHISTMVMVWTAVKYVGGGMTTLAPMINNAVHVVMYTYYMLSAEGSPDVKAFLHKHKKWMTILQMTSFNIMLIHSSQVFLPSCPAPLGVTIIYFPSVIIVYYMFYKFYQQNYGRKQRSKLIVK